MSESISYNNLIRTTVNACENDARKLLTDLRAVRATLDKDLSEYEVEEVLLSEELKTSLEALSKAREELTEMKANTSKMTAEFAENTKKLDKVARQGNPEEVTLELLDSIKGISKLLEGEDSGCTMDNLKQRATIKGIDMAPLEKALKEFEKELLTAKFPYSVPQKTPNPRLKPLVDKIIEHGDAIRAGAGFHLAFNSMFAPFEKKFKFHFYGSRKTSDISHPEWYFLQIINWIHFSRPFITDMFYDEKEKTHVRAYNEFINRLSLLTNEKTDSILADGAFEDIETFTHLIDEARRFEESRIEHDVYKVGTSALQPFCPDDRILRWCHLERIVCGSRLDQLLSGSDGLAEVAPLGLDDADPFRTVECAHVFYEIISRLAYRTAALPDPQAVKSVASVIILLVNEFQERLAQIGRSLDNPLSSLFQRVVNSVWYVLTIMEEWRDSEKYPFLMPALRDTVELYSLLWMRMSEQLANALINELGDSLLAYQGRNWLYPSTDDEISEQSAFLALRLTLMRCLADCSRGISKEAGQPFYTSFIKKFSTVFFEDVLMNTLFSQAGGELLLKELDTYLKPELVKYAHRFTRPKSMEWQEPLNKILDAGRFLALPNDALQQLLKDADVQLSDEFDETLATFKIRHLGAVDVTRLAACRSKQRS
ncbi:unnamed protein product, partial [Mesorhabditis spiculigera]